MTLASLEDSPQFFRWEYILTSGFLAIGIAFATYSVAALNPESYSQLIVGSIAWDEGLKQPDYALLFSAVISFLAIYLGLYKLSQSIVKVNGSSAEFAFRQLLGYSLIPCGILLGKALVRSEDLLPELTLEVSSASLLAVLLTIVLAAFLAFKQFANISYQKYVEYVGSSILFVVLSIFAGIALALAIGRVHLAWQFTDINQVLSVSGIGTFLFCLPLLKTWLEPLQSLNVLRSKLRMLLWAAQAFLPLFFLVLLPTPWSVEGHKIYGQPFTNLLPLLTLFLIVIAYADWLRRFKPAALPESEDSIFSAVSPIGLIGLLLYLKAVNISAGALFTDDYHWGEFLLPWWLWKNFNAIPFWDYEPARGLVNYVGGVFANLFFGDTAFACSAALTPYNALWILPFLSISFLAISQAIGLMPAFLACLLMPMANALSEVDCLSIAALCIQGTAFFTRRWSRWLLIWGSTSVAMLLFAPGQGAILILSTLPIAGFVLVQAIRKERQRLIATVAGMSFIFLLLGLITPLGKMLLGAVRYLVEQSSINSIAHGVPWAASVGSNPILSYWLWEGIRIYWILVGMLSGLLILRACLDKAWAERYRFAVFGVPILLMTILLIPRAAGRIDAGHISRLGLASVSAICLLLPIVLMTAYGQRRKALSLIIVAFLGSTLVGVPVPDSVFAKPTRSVEVKSLDQVNGARVSRSEADRLGLPTLANAFIDPAQFDRLKAIKLVLSAVLDPGETYLDLTNRSADYFYLGYPPPIASGALYNMPHRNQQLRAVQRLKAAPPPIVLASADNMPFDGGPASLRTYLLYRYVVEHYTPVKIDKFIYLVRPDRLQRLNTQALGNALVIKADSLGATLNLLDQVFRAVDLQKIPISWGASFKSLKSSLQVVKEVDTTAIVELHAVKQTKRNTYQITGKDPFIVFDVEKLSLNGQDAGILTFDFSSNPRSIVPILEVYWSSESGGNLNEETVVRFSAKRGKVVVPLDAAPRWLLSKGIKTIRFDVADPIACLNFSISNMTLSQRTELGKN